MAVAHTAVPYRPSQSQESKADKSVHKSDAPSRTFSTAPPQKIPLIVTNDLY